MKVNWEKKQELKNYHRFSIIITVVNNSDTIYLYIKRLRL